MFNLVVARMEINDAKVLDLFAGTGALGLEALSRGASRVNFVDSDNSVLQYARKNATLLHVVRQCSFFPVCAINYLRRSARTTFDLILADPPYEMDLTAELPDMARNHLSEGGIFVLEHDRHIHFDDHHLLLTSRRYGRSIVSVFDGFSHA